jgi:hypothetical protein
VERRTEREEEKQEATAEILMPSKNYKQHRFMVAAAHDPEFAKKAHIPQSVAREFEQADQRMAPEQHGYFKVPKEQQE